MVKEQIITLFFHLEDRSGTLSHLLQVVAESGCNVLSIHQTIPLQGRANVTLSVSTRGMDENIDLLMNKLRKLEFVERDRKRLGTHHVLRRMSLALNCLTQLLIDDCFPAAIHPIADIRLLFSRF